MTELAASVALHGLSLAVASKVVGSTTLVARSRTGTTNEAATASGVSAISATASSNRAATAHVDTCRVRASTSQVARLAAVVAATAARTATAQTEGWAVCLDMAKTLAVIALLGLGSARQRASIRLVAGLLAVVAETLSGRAHLGVVADIAAFIARATGERRHFGGFKGLPSGYFLLNKGSEFLLQLRQPTSFFRLLHRNNPKILVNLGR